MAQQAKKASDENLSRQLREADTADGDHRTNNPSESKGVGPVEAGVRGIEADPNISQARRGRPIPGGEEVGQPAPELKHIKPPAD